MRWIFIGIALGVGFMLASYLVSALQTLFLLTVVAAIASAPVWIWLGKAAIVLFAALWFWSMATSEWNFRTWKEDK